MTPSKAPLAAGDGDALGPPHLTSSALTPHPPPPGAAVSLRGERGNRCRDTSDPGSGTLPPAAALRGAGPLWPTARMQTGAASCPPAAPTRVTPFT